MYMSKENIIKNIDISSKTPGQIFKAAREDSGISMEEVTQALLLNKNVIHALETDDYSNIVAKVYAEGYIKAYAAFLHLPVAAMLESFRKLNLYHERVIQPIGDKAHQDAEKSKKILAKKLNTTKNLDFADCAAGRWYRGEQLQSYLLKSKYWINASFKVLKSQVMLLRQLSSVKLIIIGLVVIIGLSLLMVDKKTQPGQATTVPLNTTTLLVPVTTNTGSVAAAIPAKTLEKSKKIKKAKKSRQVVDSEPALDTNANNNMVTQL